MNELRFENISIGYSEPLVSNINLNVKPGRFISLLGDNGSGKSTLMKTLLKIIPPLKGEIFFNNENINEYSSREWATVFSAVFSRMGKIPQIRVNELIKIGAGNIESETENNIAEWLQIDNLMNKFATEISDGRLQKVMIARALMQNTPFVIFDEPTAHLDYKHKNRVFEILKMLVTRSGKTFIVITHEILQALYLSDEIWLIQNDRLHHGTPQDINLEFGLEKEVLKLSPYVRN